MTRAATTLFYAGAAFAGWILAGYPALLAALPRRPWRQAPIEPEVTVLLPAFQEHAWLPAKLRSIAALDYPRKRLQTVVVSDGDAELAALARRAAPDAVVVALSERQGKPTAMNAGLQRATGDLVLITDAHSVLAPRSLRAAVRHFDDPNVWGVSGREAEQDSAYDRYEHCLRQLETRSGTAAGVWGGFLLVRREHLPTFPREIVNDDLWLLCRLAEQGGRVLYEPEAVGSKPRLTLHAEFERRARIGAGRVGALDDLTTLPRSFAWRLASHKIGRLALPPALAAVFVSSVTLAARPGYRALALAQGQLYALGVLDLAGLRVPRSMRMPARAAAQALAGNAAVAAGIVRAARGRQDVRWQAVR
jgi:cellulose synthase/poly-beta-1,6-N-acetylglucosamine synthase-like glycosyltransferase